jgi:hypothetical protein
MMGRIVEFKNACAVSLGIYYMDRFITLAVYTGAESTDPPQVF